MTIENVRIAVRDSTDSYTLTFMDNSADDAIHYSVADLTRYIEGNASLLQMTFNKNHIDANEVVSGNKLAFTYKGKDYWLNIIESSDRGHQRELMAFSLSIEMNNEKAVAFSSSEAKNFKWYLEYFDFERSLTLGKNEVSDKSLKLSWEGSQSILGRLYSLANKFDAELEFTTELNEDYSLKKNIINVYKKHDENNQGIGQNKTGEFLRVGEELSVINRKESITNLYSAIKGTGKDGLSLVDMKFEEKDSKGNILYLSNGNGVIYAPQTRDRYPSNPGHADNDGYVLEDKGQTEYSTKEALKGYLLSELKKNSVINVEYEVDGYFDSDPGDTFSLEDSVYYKPTLFLEARVSEQTESLIGDASKNKTTFSNFIEFSSDLDASLMSKVQALIDANKAYEYQIISDNGTIFKNSEGQTVLTARMLDGVKDVTDEFKIFWKKDGATISESKTITVTATDVPNKAVYRFEAVDKTSEAVRGGVEVTITNIDDGKDGKGIKSEKDTYARSTNGITPPAAAENWTPEIPDVPAGEYLWKCRTTTYTDDTTTKSYISTLMGKDGKPGNEGKGITRTDVEWQAGTSGTIPPPGKWLTTIPPVIPDQYLWTRTTFTYTDNTTSISYSVGKMGADGKDARLLYLTATAETMIFNTDDTPKYIQTAHITAKLQNATGSVQFKAIPYIDDEAQAEIKLSGSGNNRVLSSSQWTNAAWTMIAVTATLDELTDTISVIKIRDGQSEKTYYTWANSKDGNLDFTTEYPNENLLTHSKFESMAGWTASTNLFSCSVSDKIVTLIKNKADAKRGYVVNSEVFPELNKKYSGSVDVLMNTGATNLTNSAFFLRATLTTGGIQDCCNVSLANVNKGNWVNVKFENISLPATTDITQPLQLYIALGKDAIATLKATKPKLEISPKSTIYVPSYTEDAVNSYMHYRGVCSTYDKVQPIDPSRYHWETDPSFLQAVTDGKLDQDQFQQEKDSIYEVIGGKADSKEFQALLEMAESLRKSYEAFVSNGGQYEADLKALEERAVELYQQLGEKVAQFEFINTYMRWGEEGFTIGAQNSAMKMLLTEDTLSFIDNGKTVAYFSGQSFYINRGAIVESLQVGNHKMTKVNDDHTIFQFVGV
ncbi:hypothetical protein [Enterococcus sp. AZ109]|uniref:hypothetical protein n=1 Tax=Enterococcus sp. AZ109 TaxID=2774634 RepID=UPI003F1E5EA3